MLRRAAALIFVLCFTSSRAALAQPTLADLQNTFEEVQPEVRDFWTFMNAFKEEERALTSFKAQVKEAEEAADRDPASRELRARADELERAGEEMSARHEKNVPGYNRRVADFRKRVEAVVAELDSFQRAQTKDDSARILKLRFFADLGRFLEMRDDAARIFETHPDDRDVRFAYAETLMVVPVPADQALKARAPDFPRVLELLEPLARAEATNAEVQFIYGVAASAMDRNAEATAAFDAVGSITSVFTPVRFVIGSPQREAYATWRETAAGLAKDPGNRALRRRRAELELETGANERAIADAEAASKVAPGDPEPRKLLARAYGRAQRYDDAAPLYESLVGELERDAELRGDYAVFLYRTGKTKECLDQLLAIEDATGQTAKLRSLIGVVVDEIQKKTPEEPHVEILMSKFRADLGDFTVIWDWIPKFHHLLPDQPIARFVYAETLMCVPVPRSSDPKRQIARRPPRFAKVHELLAPLVQSDPTNKEVLLLHGVAACALGKDAEARRELDAVASVESIRPVVRELLGSTSRPRETFARWHEIARGLAEHPDDTELHEKRARLLLEVDAGPLAIRDAEVAAKAGAENPAIKGTLVRAYFAGGRYEKALDALQPEGVATLSSEVLPCYVASLYDANRITAFKALWDATEDRTPLLKELPSLQGILRMAPKQVDRIAAAWEQEEKARASDAAKDDLPRVLLETAKGTIVLELFEDTAANTVANFLWLAENGFYDGVKFTRVVPGFMAQGGDRGARGCGYNIADELKGNPRLHWRSTLSMAHPAQPDSGNCQFLLGYVPSPHLDPVEVQGRWTGYTVFGRIIEGQDAADSLEAGDAIVKASILRKRDHEDKPVMIPIAGQVPWKAPAKKE